MDELQITEFSIQSQSVRADGGFPVSIPRFVPSQLRVECNPSTVQVGISCGMDDMCGLDPCLCGASDSWGMCACNGVENIYPNIIYDSSDVSVATVEYDWFGNPVVIPHGDGDAVITARASLAHYDDAQAQGTVHIEGPTAIDCYAGVGCIALIVFIVGALYLVRHALDVHRSHRDEDYLKCGSEAEL